MAQAGNAERKRYWRDLIGRQRSSGQSIAAFCRETGVSAVSFHEWKRKLRRQTLSAHAEAEKTVFAPVQIMPEQTASSMVLGGRIEVVLPDGVVLRIAADCDERTLQVVWTVLGASRAKGPDRC